MFHVIYIHFNIGFICTKFTVFSEVLNGFEIDAPQPEIFAEKLTHKIKELYTYEASVQHFKEIKIPYSWD